MLLTLTVMRTPAQHVRARMHWWAVGHGTNDLAEVTWDPAGALTAREAAIAALERVLEQLRSGGPGAPADGEGSPEPS